MFDRLRHTSFAPAITTVLFCLFVFGGLATQAHDDSLPGQARAPAHTRENMRKFAEEHHHNEFLAAQSITTCQAGMAGTYPCSNVDLMAFLPLAQIGGGNGNDIWGWTDAQTGKEYAIMGLTNGTAFVDISDPVNPVFMGHLPPHPGVSNSSWRDIKTYYDHAFIGSEASNSGMQIVDLTQLRSITSPPVTISETAFYLGFTSSHNIVINEDSAYAYAVGTNSGNCSRGLHFVDILNPTSPQAAGCFGADGYTHDAQCVNYLGPDPDHQGKEICFAYNEDTLTIVDVSNKSAPVQLSRSTYDKTGYAHQGWVTEDHRFLLMDDELDENRGLVSNTRTLIWNIEDLDNPSKLADHAGVSTSIDHNQYIVGDYSYQANYRSGLRILDISDIANGNLSEAGFFDIYTSNDSTGFNGAWSVYPFFASGNVIISGIEQGLFIVRPNLTPLSDPPAVTLIDPADDANVSGIVPIRINATDDLDADDALLVEWNVDGGPWQPTNYSFPEHVANWDSQTALNNPHVINARAIDNDLQAGSDSHNVTSVNALQQLTVDAVIVNVIPGKGNRNTGTATIMVSDSGGAPVADALVETTFSGDRSWATSDTTDTNGEASVNTPRVKNLDFVMLCVDAVDKAGWELDFAGSTLCGDSDGGGSAFGKIEGNVSDAATPPGGISNASVSTDSGQSGDTDSFGDYSILDVPIGNRTVSVTASTYVSQNTSATVFESATSIVNFVLDKASTGGSGAIKGTVYSGVSKLSGVTVITVLGGSSSQTNKGGKYSIQNVPAGSQMVEATKDGYLSQPLEVTVVAGGSVNLNFNLAPDPN